jgi:hypothetical protein
VNIQLLELLSKKRALEAKWASEFLAHYQVTLGMIHLSKEIKHIEQEMVTTQELLVKE